MGYAPRRADVLLKVKQRVAFGSLAHACLLPRVSECPPRRPCPPRSVPLLSSLPSPASPQCTSVLQVKPSLVACSEFSLLFQTCHIRATHAVLPCWTLGVSSVTVQLPSKGVKSGSVSYILLLSLMLSAVGKHLGLLHLYDSFHREKVTGQTSASCHLSLGFEADSLRP